MCLELPQHWQGHYCNMRLEVVDNMYVKLEFVHFQLDYMGGMGSSQMDSVELGGGK